MASSVGNAINRSNREKTVALFLAVSDMMLFDCDTDDEAEEVVRKREVVVKVENYAELIVPAMSDLTFKTHFRLKRSTFTTLLDKLSLILQENIEGCTSFVDPSKQLMITIWILGNQDSFREVGDRFGVSRSTAHKVLVRGVNALLRLNRQEGIISWPDQNRSIEIQQEFLRSYRFPSCVGAIDGCHIPIKAPIVSSGSYINRKGFHSILLQGVCDNNLLFIDVYTGEVGSMHDARMFQRSDLCERMAVTPAMFPNNSHIIGDLAYPLKQHLLVGFKDNGRLTRAEQRFNRTLSAARSSIERAFGLLKNRWRRLKYLNMSTVDFIPAVIFACCILHNVCLLNDDMFDVPTWNDDDDCCMHVDAASNDADRHEGARKRIDIMNTL